MSTHALRSALEKAGAEVAREECRAALHARIQEVCWRWSEVKVCLRSSRSTLDFGVGTFIRG